MRDLVADAKARIAAARSPDEVREVLTRISERIFGRDQRSPSTALPDEANHAFFTEQYANWTHFLLKSVLPNWVLCFSREERARFFDSFFTSPEVPQVDAFLALAQALIEFGRSGDAARTGGAQSSWNEGLRAKNPIVLEVRHRPTPLAAEEAVEESEQGANKDEKDFIVKTVAGLLGTMITTDGGLSRLFAHFARHEGPHAGQESLWVRVLGLLCSLPDRITAVYRDATSEIPHALREQQFTRLVTTQALNALQLKHVSERALLAQIGQLYGKLSLVGRGTAMMEALLPLILAHIHDREWRSRFVAIVRAVPQNAAEGFVHALLLQLDSTKQFSSDFVATTLLAVTQGTQEKASGAQHSPPPLYQLRSQVLLELFGETVSHADSRGEHASGKRNDNALSFLFLHKLLLVKVYPASVLRVLLDFIARLGPMPPTDKGKEKATGADGMDEGTCADLHNRGMQPLLNALVKVVGVWGEKSFIRHSSYEQHRYLFKAITFGLSYLAKEDLTSTDGLLIGLVSGVQNYIAYPVGRTRSFGMIVAEQFSRILDPEAEKPLEFEYQPLSDDEDEEGVHANEGAADAIERASTAPAEDVTPPTERKKRRRRKKQVDDDPDALFLANEEEAPEDDVVGDEDLQLEGSDTGGSSEDELEAYDLEDDESDLSQVKIPVYLRDVLAGLRAKDEPDRLEGAIKAAEGLIRADARGDLHDISLELMRTLLHLFNQYELEGFGEMRFKAMIALLASDEETPKLVKYLTDQFYAQNYSIQQRVDMLVVMAEAAKELADSSLEPMFPPSSSHPHAKAIEAPAAQGQPLLRETKDINLLSGLSPARFASLYIDRDSRRSTFDEDQRLPYLPSHDSTNDTAESSTMVVKHPKPLGKETRRTGGRKGPAFAQSGKANRFVDVHGLFFYPLMRGYDSVDNTFNLLGEDSIVLSKLLHALSVFIECMGSAAPPSALYRMVRALVDFVWAVRYHREANVRRAALLAAARTIALVPVSLLVSDFLEDFNEVQAWLVSVYRDDPDEHSRALASASLLELRKVAELVTRQQLNDPTNLLSG